MSLKKILAVLIGILFATIAGASVYVISLTSDLPQIIKVEDYKPLLVSEVYDRNGKKFGEFFREKRILVPYTEMPEHLVQAFVAAEDSSFFSHDGLNFIAIFRAMIANIQAGRKVQGGSTITQQVARSLLLTSEKTYTRKIKEAFLARRMEQNLSKQNIMYLYLNQIYLGQGAYGVGAAADIYFRKPAKELTIAEAALLAGLPQAPSRYSPIYNPSSAKARQKYVLGRMAEEDFITDEKAEAEINSPLQVYVRKNYKEEAPFYLETVRQMLVSKLGEVQVLDNGIKIYTGLDLAKQQEAQNQIQKNLRELDKRQGFRGPLKNLTTPEEVAEFLLTSRNNMMDEMSPIRVIQPDGSIQDKGPLNLTGKNEKGEVLPPLPDYVQIDQIVEGVVTSVDDDWGLATVRFGEGKGLINVETMEWARNPDPKKLSEGDKITKPSQALKKGDVIQLRPIAKKFQADRIDKKLAELKKKAGAKYKRPEDLPNFDEYAELLLEQEPNAQASLISFDQNTQEVIALVGGYSFEKSEFNRALQAARQTGSSFKPIVYAAALDRNYTPATPILDAPIVFEEEAPVEEGQETIDEKEITKWKPTNHGKNFSGEVLFRNALIKSMNIPTVKIIQDLGVNWVEQYARRLEIFSPLNKDFTLALGSSGVTLYEMTKAFAIIARLGRATSPILIHKVEDNNGQVIHPTITLDERFEKELTPIREEFEKRRQEYLAQEKNKPAEEPSASGEPDGEESETTSGDPKPLVKKDPSFFFSDPAQLISPQLAYLVTSLLQGAVEEGTGRAAKALGRPTAGKTGTTNGYYDAWFVGYTADITTGVWVGFDDEKTLGVGEVGGKSALPIWLEYMKFAHENIPAKSFKTPDGIVFANIDNKTGKLASANSEEVVRQAFIEGTEPQDMANQSGSSDEDKDFFKEDLSQ